MKLRTTFYIILVFTMTAFAWWTYSLIKLSYEVHLDDKDKLGYEVHKATRTVLLNSKFKQDDDTVFTDMKLGTHVIYFDTAAMRQMLKERHEHVDLLYKDKTVELLPDADIVKKLENDKNRKVRMYLVEGVVFLILLMFGFSWLYNRLTAIIRLNQQKSNFLLAVTHELKTPIASVKLFLETIQRRELTREQMKPMIDNCIEDVNRQNELVDNMLLATRIEGKSYQYHFEEIDLSTLLSGITENYIKKKGAEYTFEEQIEEGVDLKLDIFSITLAVHNLIENALKYSPKQTTITIGLKKEGDKIALTIADEGVGIPKEERLNIFTKFYRLGNESTRTTKGTGLGLYIVKEIVDHHKALIEVHSNTPKGSVFKILFKPLPKS